MLAHGSSKSTRNGRHTAKQNVDEAVSAADASLDPDRDGWEDDGEDAKADVASTHDCCEVL